MDQYNLYCGRSLVCILWHDGSMGGCRARLCVPIHPTEIIEPCSRITRYLSQYGSVCMNSLLEDAQIPAGCSPLSAEDLVHRGHENPATLATMGPALFTNFFIKKTFMDRRNLLLVNGRSFLWALSDIYTRSDGGLPLLYPVDRFNFEDFDGFKKLLITLPPLERPNLFCDKYFPFFIDVWDVFEEMFDVGFGRALWQWGFAFWEDQRLLEWNPPDNAAAFY